jgi:hypothetical protein
MNDREQLISKLRHTLVYGAPDLQAVESACEGFLDWRRRSRAVTERDLVAVDVTVEEEVVP